MDGAFYWDTREPFISADLAQVALSASAKALYDPGAFPVLGGQYFSRLGKKIKIRMFGNLSTGATPGNGMMSIFWGTGADSNGTLLVSSPPFVLVANATSISFWCEVNIHCRTTGSAGALFVDGKLEFGSSVTLVDPIIFPASAAVSSTSLDLTAANIISVQMRRTGSTAEVMKVQDLTVIAVN